MESYIVILLVVALVWLFDAVRCSSCPAPEFLSHDGVNFTPSKVHVGRGDQAIVQCVVEYYQDRPPQTSMYVNDCRLLGFNDHPSWVSQMTQVDGPCSHTTTDKLCRTLTMYINGTAEAQDSRVYCCARLGGRVCSPNSTISVLEPSHSTGSQPTESTTEGCSAPPRPTTTTLEVSSSTPLTTVAPSGTPTVHQLLTTKSTNNPITIEQFEFSSSSGTLSCTLFVCLLLVSITLGLLLSP